MRGAEEVHAGRLFVLGGAIPSDGRVTWLPEAATGFQPGNVYLLLEPDGALLVDTGLARFGPEIADQLAAILPAGVPLAVFMTRAELDCTGNLGLLAQRFPLAGLHAGGKNNPFDSFDVASGGTEIHLDLARTARIAVGAGRELQVLDTPLRLLSTYWAWDEATRTLFTSDSFGHLMTGGRDDSRLADSGDEVDEEAVADHLLTKFDWLPQSDPAPVAAGLERIFAEHDVEVIAPTNGRVIRGREAVGRHLTAVVRALRSQPRFGTRSGAAGGPTARPAPAEPAHRPPADRELPILPRQLAPAVHWLGGCVERIEGAQPYHFQISVYLLVGTRQTLLIDCGHPTHWPRIERDLERLLGGRDLDWIFPTHSEIPHCANLPRALRRFPKATVVADTRDYQLHYPDLVHRFVDRAPGDVFDLGGGVEFEIMEALIRDLPGTLWGYERSSQALFVSDAFGYTHHVDAIGGDPVHLPGECALLSTELSAPPTVEQTAFLTRGALYWTRYTDLAPYFAAVESMMRTHPTRIVAPAHANVIDDFAALLPMLREAYGLEPARR